MKKLFRRIGALAVTAMMSFGALIAFGGCDNTGDNESSSVSEESSTSEQVQNQPIIENGCMQIADFESYDDIAGNVKSGWSFGTWTLITKGELPGNGVAGKHLYKAATEAELVTITRGNQSLKCEILGREELWGKRSPYIGFKTDGTYFNKYDFNDCESVLVDIYNAMDYDLNVAFYMCPDSSVTSQPYRYYFTVKPGMNNVEIPVDYSILSYGYKEILDRVEELGFIFERGELHEETQVVYIDNFRVKLMEG
jgi:hypothetical protein